MIQVIITLPNIYHNYCNFRARKYFSIKLCVVYGLWCLTSLSTIFKLYRGGQFYCEPHPSPSF